MSSENNSRFSQQLQTIIEQNREVLQQAQQMLDRTKKPAEVLQALNSTMTDPTQLSMDDLTLMRRKLGELDITDRPNTQTNIPTNRSRQLSKILHRKQTI